MFQSKPICLWHQRHDAGFGVLTAMAVALAILCVTLFTVNTVTSGQRSVRQLRVRANANLVMQRLEAVLANPNVRANLIATQNLLGGSVAHDPASSKTLTCILAIHEGGTTPCDDQTRPVPVTGACSGLATEKKRNACWVLKTLERHKASVLFGPDATKTAAQDLLIDNRSLTGGVDGNLFVCQDFEVLGGSPRCSFRVELFVWVQCQGGEPKCGGSSGVTGTVYMAAILRPAKRFGLLDSGAMSILDVTLGTI